MTYVFVWIVNMIIINWVGLPFKRSLRGYGSAGSGYYVYMVLSSAFKRTTGNQGSDFLSFESNC